MGRRREVARTICREDDGRWGGRSAPWVSAHSCALFGFTQGRWGMKTMTRWTLLLSVALTWPGGRGDAQVGAPAPEQIATGIEASAATLHDVPDRWNEAATLYVAAAEIRAAGDPRAQKDLFAAANLFVQIGSVGRAIGALEAAGARALASGDADLARERFADAALVAQRAGLSREHQRLSYRTTEVAMVAKLPAVTN